MNKALGGLTLLMGSNTNCYIIWVIIIIMFCVSEIVHGMNNTYDPDSLDDFVHHRAHEQVPRPRTGILYNISLPANFTGMKNASFVRVRIRNFWLNGANFSSISVPPGMLPVPFVKRFDFICQNLGNWSSHYHKVPNHTLIAPVIGFKIYNTTNGTLGFSLEKDPILVHFPWFSLPVDKNVTVQCVRFGENGSIELSNMTTRNLCTALDQGHFSIVIPSNSNIPRPSKKKKERVWKWWVIGFGVGVVGLVFVTLLAVLTYKFVKRERNGKMERESERSEALETTWVGMSKMPSAAGIRTQPVIENDYIP